ncbi:MAG: TonB-dependent receptor, partial [Cyclonatronaceae bacterium]
ERVEVLKGPQGTLFGRGAQIGAVHIIQNKPTNIFSGAITSGFGSENERLVRGFVNVPIIQDRLFSRVALLYNEREGFIENISGGNLNGKDTFAGRVSLRYLPDDRTIIDLIGNYQYDNPPGTSFKSGTYAPAGGSVDPTSTADMERGNDLYIDRTVWDITLLGERVLSDRWELNSITAYREFDSYESFDADGTAAPVLWFAEDAYGQQFSQELRLNFDNDKSFRGFMGSSYFWEDGYQRVPFETDERSFFALLSPFLADFGVPFIPLITPDGQVNQPVQVNPLTGQPLKEFHAEENTNFGTLSAYEIFADGSFDLTPRLTLTAGLRFTYEDVTGAQETPVADTPGTLGQVLGAGSNNLFVPTEGKLSRSETFTSLVGRLNASYEFSESTNLFGNISRGRRPNVINVTASGSTVLDEEIVWSYEAGVKQLAFNNSLAIDLSGFYYDYSNFQTSVTELTDDGLVAEARDTGEATAYGLETSLRYNLNRNISFFGSYGYTDATIDDEDSDGNPQELAGNRFRLTPEHSFALGGSFRANINPSVGIFIDPSYTWKSEVFFEEDNDPEIREDAYGLLNLRAGASFYNERLELAFYGKNLLDHAYIIDAGNTGGAFGIPTFIAGPPRLIGLQITGRF